MKKIIDTIFYYASKVLSLGRKIFSWAKKHRWLTGVILIVIVIISIIVWRQSTKIPQYITDKVSRATIVSEVSESGNVQAEGQADIYSSANGVVGEIYVQNDQYVYTGQSLFAISPDVTDAEKTTAYGQYLAAQSNVKTVEQNRAALTVQIRTAKKQLTDATTLYKTILTSITTDPNTTYTQSDLASAKMAYLAAKKNVEVLNQNYNIASTSITAAQEAETAAKVAWEGKSFLVVKAPTNGYVSNLSISRGDRVSAAALSVATSPALIVADSHHLLFKSQINEIDILKIKIGQSGNIVIDALKDKNFTGRVTKIDSVGTNNQGVISYNIYLTINNPDLIIRSGMSGNMTIETEKHEDVLTVLNSAIKPYQDGKAVQVIDRSKKQPELKYIPVEIGLKGTERTEILKGLDENTQVVINNTPNQFKASIFGGR